MAELHSPSGALDEHLLVLYQRLSLLCSSLKYTVRNFATTRAV